MLEAPAALFMADFGKPVVWGTYVATGILDMPDDVLMGGMVVSTDYRLTVPADALPGLDSQQTIAVGGVAYSVRHVRAADDGAFVHVFLSKI